MPLAIEAAAGLDLAHAKIVVPVLLTSAAAAADAPLTFEGNA